MSNIADISDVTDADLDSIALSAWQTGKLNKQDQARNFKHKIQVTALELDVPYPDALSFETTIQVKALEIIKFSFPNELYKTALEFKTDIQLRALELTKDPDLSLKFHQDTQIEALEHDEDLGEKALKFHNPNAVQAFKTDLLNSTQALRVWHKVQAECLENLNSEYRKNLSDITEQQKEDCIGLNPEYNGDL